MQHKICLLYVKIGNRLNGLKFGLVCYFDFD